MNIQKKASETGEFRFFFQFNMMRAIFTNRFAQLQSRFSLALLLKSFKISVNERTKDPLEYAIEYPGWTVVGGTWLNITRI
jgi:hypothetical protein